MSFADALGWIGLAIIFLAIYLQIVAVRTGSQEKAHVAHGVYAIGLWIQFLACVIDQDPVWAGLLGALAAWHTWLWWKGRRKGRGKRALKDLGAKSRARIERLVRQMTPSPIPSPVGG